MLTEHLLGTGHWGTAENKQTKAPTLPEPRGSGAWEAKEGLEPGGHGTRGAGLECGGGREGKSIPWGPSVPCLSLGHGLPASLLLLHAYKFLLSSGSFCFVGQEIHFSISLITWPQNWLPLNPVDFIVCSL